MSLDRSSVNPKQLRPVDKTVDKKEEKRDDTFLSRDKSWTDEEEEEEDSILRDRLRFLTLPLSSVSAEKGMLLRLDFRDEFKLEDSTDCRYDFLEVRDGQHGFSNLLGNFCGTNFPPEITSKTRYLWLRFHSDESIEGKGFRAVWSMVPRQTNIRKCHGVTIRPSRCHRVVPRFSYPARLGNEGRENLPPRHRDNNSFETRLNRRIISNSVGLFRGSREDLYLRVTRR